MKLRMLLVGALVFGSIFVGAGPASATCRPERPQTCEIEDPFNCYLYVELPGHSFTINYCDPSSLIPQ